MNRLSGMRLLSGMVQVLPPQSRPRIGLALGSGAARGWAHLGVIRALARHGIEPDVIVGTSIGAVVGGVHLRSEEHTSELQSLMRISYAVFCLKKKKNQKHYIT